ncbi:unnamed protein product [Merluccius merluccius]
MVDARLKVRLARLHLEAQEKAQVFEAQERTQRLAHELALRKLEIEAETVKLKQMELQSAAVPATSIASPGTPTHPLPSAYDGEMRRRTGHPLANGVSPVRRRSQLVVQQQVSVRSETPLDHPLDKVFAERRRWS